MKKTIFYSVLALSAFLLSLSFLFAQYIAYNRFILASEELKFEQNKAAYECMAKYYPAAQPDEKGFLISSQWDSCLSKFK